MKHHDKHQLNFDLLILKLSLQYFFGEDQGRYVIELSKTNMEKAKKILEKNSVHYDEIGTVDKSKIIFDNNINLSVDELENENKTWLRKYMIN